jgi:hypothetical protein
MPIDDLDTLRAGLRKRGFRIEDPQLHVCPDCGAKAIERHVISGRAGGRDDTICIACGKARSWRSEPGLEVRTEDQDFDLRAFLR